jgi:hypothetical protein
MTVMMLDIHDGDSRRHEERRSEETQLESRETASTTDPVVDNSHSEPQSPSRTLHKKKSSYDLRDDFHACASVQDTPLSTAVGAPESSGAISSPREQ